MGMYTEISQKTGLIQEEVLQETFKQWKYSYLTHFVRLTFKKKYHVSQKSRSIYIDQGHTREHSSKRPALKTDCANLSCISGQLLTLQEILKISNKYFWFFKSFFLRVGVLIKARIFPTLKIKRFFPRQKSVSFPKITAGCSFLCSQQRESQSFTPCDFQPQIPLMVAFMSGKNCLQSIGICSTQNTVWKKKQKSPQSPLQCAHARAVVMRVSFLVLSKPQADPSTGNRRYVAGYLLTQTH